MAYNALIPQATDQISVSQAQILANFTALGVIAGNSQVGSPSLNSNAGFNFVYLAPATTPTVPAGNNAIYSANNATTARNEIYVLDAAATQIPMTARQLGTNGWTYLPSGIKIVWGNVNGIMGLNTITFTMVASFPGFTSNAFNATVTPGAAGVTAYISGISMTTLSVQVPTAGNFYWHAIGF